MGEEHRREARLKATFPVDVGPEGGMTLDLSGSGIAFETRHPYVVGDVINLSVILSRRDVTNPIRLNCNGRVVRVHQDGDVYRVGATVEWADDESSTLTFAGV